MLSGTSAFASDDGIVLPRLNYQRGPIVSTLAGVEGRLMFRGRCLLLGMPEILEEYLVVWPPGFRVQEIGDDILVLNGGGNFIARVGDEVTLSGNGGPDGATYSDECPAAYFYAYSVTMPSNARWWCSYPEHSCRKPRRNDSANNPGSATCRPSVGGFPPMRRHIPTGTFPREDHGQRNVGRAL